MNKFKILRGCLLAAAAMLLGANGAMAQETIKIGAVYATSGPASFLGIPEERGLRLRAEEVNKNGGINGRKVEVIVYDTEGNGTKAAQQIRRLIDSDKVHIVFGPSSSGESLLVLPIANESKVPIIMHAGTEKVVVPPTPYGFNTPPTDRVVAAHLLGVFKKRGITKIGLLTAADGFGQSGANVVKEQAAEYGVTVVQHEEFNRQDPDITAQVLRVKNSPAQAALVWSAFPAPTIILKNAAAVGLKIPMYNSFAAASRDLLVQGGKDAEGTFVSSMRLLAPETLKDGDPAKAIVLKIYNDYKAKYNEAPATFVAHSYDSMLILEEAVKKIDGPITRDKIRDAMEKVTVTGGNGTFKLSPQQHGLSAESNSMVLLVAKNGEWLVDE